METLPHSRLKAAALFLIIAILYYWRILIGHQFSMLTGYEGANQAYGWFTFLARSLHAGTSPFWDPYSFSGHPFVEELQNGALYPVNLLLALFPLNRDGVFSPGLYHWMVAITHALGGFFLFLLVRELELSFFAGLIAGCGFAFGGTLARTPGWPHLLQSFIWFPPVFYFLLRALKSSTMRAMLLNGATAGAGVALALLAGGMYTAIMQGILVVAVAVFWEFQGNRRSRTRCLALVACVGAAAGLGGSAQLLPSLSGSAHTMRTLGPTMMLASEKIPYRYLSDGSWAHGFIGLFLAPMAFDGNQGAGEVASPYMGVVVCALALIGVWKRWENLWVRFFACLTLASFAYSMGGQSLLHGLLYAFVPRLWMVRAPTRGLYLADFAVAVLCAYGADALFTELPNNWRPLRRVLKWACALCGTVLVAAALFPKIAMNPWLSLSVVLILGVSVLLWRVSRGSRSLGMKAMMVSVLLFDLYAFDWSALNVVQEREKGTDELNRLMNIGAAAHFVKGKPGPYRVQLLTNPIPNIGDVYGVEGTWGAAATVLKDYWDYRDVEALWNIRYKIRPADASEPGPIYSDANYKVYENAGGPRAWTVHKTVLEPSETKLAIDLRQPGFKPTETALIRQPLRRTLTGDAGNDRVTLDHYNPDAPVVQVNASSPALLVLSEVWDPQWTVRVNGNSASILQVDGVLRGIEIPGGFSRVEFSYRPWPAWIGMILSVGAFAGLAVAWRFRRS